MLHYPQRDLSHCLCKLKIIISINLFIYCRESNQVQMVNTATRTAHELRVYYRRHIYSRGVIVYFYHLQHYALYMVNIK